MDGYVAAFVDAVTGGTQLLDAAQAKVAATYAQVEQTLPGVAYENNPMLQAQSPITQQATRIAALEAEVTRLAHAAAEANLADDTGGDALLRTVQARIHSDIQAIVPLLKGEKVQAPKATLTEQENSPQQSVRSWMLAQESLADQPQPSGARQGQSQTGGGLALIRIHDITSQLAAELGASAEAPHFAAAS